MAQKLILVLVGGKLAAEIKEKYGEHHNLGQMLWSLNFLKNGMVYSAETVEECKLYEARWFYGMGLWANLKIQKIINLKTLLELLSRLV